jgi:hypothetical protein
MKVLIGLLILTAHLHAATWKAGEETFELTEDPKKDWVTSSCLKECEIDRLAAGVLKAAPPTEEELSGGRNPGSVICKKILGQVVYLEREEQTEAFCKHGDSLVSLSRLTRLFLK